MVLGMVCWGLVWWCMVRSGVVLITDIAAGSILGAVKLSNVVRYCPVLYSNVRHCVVGFGRVRYGMVGCRYVLC